MAVYSSLSFDSFSLASAFWFRLVFGLDTRRLTYGFLLLKTFGTDTQAFGLLTTRIYPTVFRSTACFPCHILDSITGVRGLGIASVMPQRCFDLQDPIGDKTIKGVGDWLGGWLL